MTEAGSFGDYLEQEFNEETGKDIKISDINYQDNGEAEKYVLTVKSNEEIQNWFPLLEIAKEEKREISKLLDPELDPDSDGYVYTVEMPTSI